MFAPPPARKQELKRDDVEELKTVMAAYRLRALRDFHLLDRHFRGDARAFLAYTLPRMHPRQVELAKIRNATSSAKDRGAAGGR